MTPGTDAQDQDTAERKARTPGLEWLGLPAYPGILVFFVSAALSHHLFDIVRRSQHGQLPAETLEALLLGVLATAVSVALVRRLVSGDRHTALFRLSGTLLPGMLLVFAPFRYAQVCRWTDWCRYWSDLFLVVCVALCVVVGVYAWWDGLRSRAEQWAAAARAWIDRASPSVLFWSAWAACLVLLAWRGHERLVHPELFAEGGRHFVADALSHGWESVATPYAGYLHVAPRVLAVLAVTLVPMAYVPAFTTLWCFLTAAAVSAFIARPAFRWLIPSDAVRLAAALLLCLVPGLREVLGNLPSLHYLLIILLGLLVLKDPRLPYRNWELALAFLITLSSGMVAALIPAVAVRLWLRLRAAPGRGLPQAAGCRAGEAGTREIAFAAVIVLPVMITGLSLLAGGDAVPRHGTGSPGDEFELATVLKAWGTILTSSILLHPFSGSVATTEIMLIISLPVLVAIAGGVYLLLFRHLIAARGSAHAALVFAWFCFPFMLIALIALLRSPGLEMFLVEEDWEWYKWWMRYNYLFAVFGIASWLFLLRPAHLLPGPGAANILVVVLCVAYASQANWYFDIEEYGAERRWEKTSAALERAVHTGCPRKVKVDLYPDGWSFTYRAAGDNRACASRSE